MWPCNQFKIHVVSQKNHIHFEKLLNRIFNICLKWNVWLVISHFFRHCKSRIPKTKINEYINKSCQIWMWHCCTQRACLTLRPHDEIRYTYLAVSKWPYLLGSWIEKIDMDIVWSIYLLFAPVKWHLFLCDHPSGMSVSSKRCWIPNCPLMRLILITITIVDRQGGPMSKLQGPIPPTKEL